MTATRPGIQQMTSTVTPYPHTVFFSSNCQAHGPLPSNTSWHSSESLGCHFCLKSKIKLNPAVANSGGAYVLNTDIQTREVEVDIEFTVQSELETSRGFMALFTQNELYPEDFEESDIGYR